MTYSKYNTVKKRDQQVKHVVAALATKQNYSAKPDDVAHFGSLSAKYIFMVGSLTYTMPLMPGTSTGTGTHTANCMDGQLYRHTAGFLAGQ